MNEARHTPASSSPAARVFGAHGRLPRARGSRVPILFMPKGKRRWNVAQVRDQPTSDRGQRLPPRLGAVAWAPSASETHGAVEYGE